MVHTATVYAPPKPFQVVVDYGRETVNPNSPHRREDSLLDDRVPLDFIITCTDSGAVTVFTSRPAPPEPGKEIECSLEVKFLEMRKTWAVVKGPGNSCCRWFENWVYIPGLSKAHCEHLITLLQGDGDISDLDPVIV